MNATPLAHPNSIRTVLVAAMAAISLVPVALIGTIGVRRLTESVRHEAQSRVDSDLQAAAVIYAERLGRLGSALEVSASGLRAASVGDESLARTRRALGLSLLNLCDPSGRPLAGSYQAGAGRVPIDRDPVLRRALQGRPASGTLVLEPARLELEGGSALRNAARITGEDGREVEGSALVWWVAIPLLDAGGRVEALLYGGRLLNLDSKLVDELRDLLFGDAGEGGAARGAVTLFLGERRVATNVRDQGGARAIGTRVSDTVRRRVLDEGRTYTGEALVVNAWYLSAYRPLRDPDGRTIGMLYVGLDRAPYDAMRRGLVARFLLPAGAVGLLAVVAALVIVRRITAPLRALGESAARLSAGDWEHELEVPPTYLELEQLSARYHEMREAIQRRDQELRARNEQLLQANQKLEQSNRNYMQTLGFVTHELKAPLGAIQMLIEGLMDGRAGELPLPAAGSMVRIQRNCEELQDMVRDYLDLSRLERGELVASMGEIDLVTDVVKVAVEQAAVFFRSRRIALAVSCPESIPAVADPGLLRIALSNFLTNAAKYGREGGEARLSVATEDGLVTLSLRNDGEGFPPAEADRLFEKFYRFRSSATRAKRGSGIGLFTVRRVAQLHGGAAWAESEPGAWAAFHLRIPVRPRGAASAPLSGPAGP
jgi:signal transduction histidine kinase